MTDTEGRKIEYLRISVTDKCNLRCAYCMPKSGVCLMAHDDLLRYEELLRLIRIFAALGIKKVRLTGGEPLVRKELNVLISGIKAAGVSEVALTTNALLLEEKLDELSAAGLDGVNISIDSVDEEIYKRMTGSYGAARVISAMERCLSLGLKVKLNCVPVRGLNDEALIDVALLAKRHPVDVRFIELMPIGCGKNFKGIESDELLRSFEESFGRSQPIGAATPYEKGQSAAGGPARYYSFEGFAGRLGFISPISHKFCDGCNRVRLTSDGFLKLCLHDVSGISLRDMMRGGAGDDELKRAITEAVNSKPAGHSLDTRGESGEIRRMNEIGG